MLTLALRLGLALLLIGAVLLTVGGIVPALVNRHNDGALIAAALLLITTPPLAILAGWALLTQGDDE